MTKTLIKLKNELLSALAIYKSIFLSITTVQLIVRSFFLLVLLTIQNFFWNHVLAEKIEGIYTKKDLLTLLTPDIIFWVVFMGLIFFIGLFVETSAIRYMMLQAFNKRDFSALKTLKKIFSQIPKQANTWMLQMSIMLWFLAFGAFGVLALYVFLYDFSASLFVFGSVSWCGILLFVLWDEYSEFGYAQLLAFEPHNKAVENYAQIFDDKTIQSLKRFFFLKMIAFVVTGIAVSQSFYWLWKGLLLLPDIESAWLFAAIIALGVIIHGTILVLLTFFYTAYFTILHVQGFAKNVKKFKIRDIMPSNKKPFVSVEQKLWKKIRWFVIGFMCAFFGFWFSTLFEFNLERIKETNTPVEIIAHRGGRGLGEENQIETFAKSVEAKADRLELDVQMSKDGVLFIFHDESFGLEVGIEGLVQNQNWEEIKDTGVLLFEDFLKWNEPNNVPLNVEFKALKEGSDKEERTQFIVSEMIHLLDLYNQNNNTVVSSFDTSLLNEVQKQSPTIKTAILLSLQQMEVRLLDDFDIVSVNQSLLSSKYLLDLKSADKEVWIWGIQNFDLNDKILAMQIDAAIIDNPIVSRKIQEEYMQKSFQSKIYDQWRFLLE